MLVIDIVSHEDFVLIKNMTELQRNIKSIIFKLTGIVIEILKNSIIHNIVKVCLSVCYSWKDKSEQAKISTPGVFLVSVKRN